MSAWAEVASRKGRLFFKSYSKSGRALVFNGWVQAAEEPADDAAVGHLTRAALAESEPDVPWPDFRSGTTPEMRRLLDTVGVKTYGQYQGGAKQVSIELDDRKPGLMITPSRNEGRRGGFVALEDQAVTLSRDIDDAKLGAAVRAALAASE